MLEEGAQKVIIVGDSGDEVVVNSDGSINISGGGGGGGSTDGWTAAGETWTYASADAPTFKFTIAGIDLTTKYSPGMRVKLTQSTGGIKYFIITAVAFSTNTTITVYGGTDYTLNNEAISSPYWSMLKAPFGFPLEPAKWSVSAVDTNNASTSATQNTWFNPGSLAISLPIGSWNMRWRETIQGTGATLVLENTISTANNSASNSAFICGGQTNNGNLQQISGFGLVTVAAKTSYFLNHRTVSTGGTSIAARGDLGPTTIEAVCAYL